MSRRRLLGLTVLTSLIWRIGLLPGLINGCGPVGSHGHELLGSADPHALEEHLAGEAACWAGHAPAPVEETKPAAQGRVLSTSAFDQLGAISSGLTVLGLAPVVAAPELPGELWSVLPLAGWKLPSLTLSPPSPPPCPTACVASTI